MNLVMLGTSWVFKEGNIGWVNMDWLLAGKGGIQILSFRNQWEKDYLEGLCLIAGTKYPQILLPGDEEFGKYNRMMFTEQSPPKDISGSFITFPMSSPYQVGVGPNYQSPLKGYDYEKQFTYKDWDPS